MTISLLQWTIEDYHRMIDAGILDDRSVELLNGQIIKMSPEGIPHAYFSDATADYLRNLLGNRAKVREGKPITLFQSSSEPEPDLAIVEPLGTVYLEHHPYPNNIFWLIELLGVDEGFTTLTSHSKPCLRLSPHTAPSLVDCYHQNIHLLLSCKTHQLMF